MNRQGHPFGLHVDGRKFWVRILAESHSLGDPANQLPVALRLWIEPHPASVRHRIGGLEDEQTFLGGGWKNPASPPLFHDVFVILLRLKAQQRQLESPLATPGLCVAASRVATRLGEDR